MSAQDFLVELGCEELPPTALMKLANAFAKGLADALDKAEIPHGEVKALATPRRLAVSIAALADKQPDREVERRGPALQAAFDGDGNPTKAAEGFARSCGVTVDQLSQLETDKGTWLAFNTTEQGIETASLLPEMIDKALHALPVPKRMRWGASRVEFSRPVHWLVMLHGDQVIPADILGLSAGRTTRGHRFHANHTIELAHANDYIAALQEACVMVEPAARRESIRDQVKVEAAKVGATAVIDEDLLEEVNGLVEWPVALMGTFEERFLEVPAECLISSMKANQKYFHLVDNEGRLLPRFITVSNIASRDPQQVIAGNEKVIRPRLADAAFFFETDRKTPLIDRAQSLESVVFQQQLGTLADKSRRIGELAAHIARQLNSDEEAARRAATLCKCDLVTEMVLEFPELQGIMGEHYARHDGEAEAVAQALNEQYMPRHAGDELPQTPTGIAIALADRLDTLTGIFGIGQRPTGVKDPFALRRATLGVLNIMVHQKLDLDLHELLTLSAQQHADLPQRDGLVETVLEYMLDRFRAWYQAEGLDTTLFLAVRARNVTRPLDFDRRVHAVAAFTQLPEAAALAAANKRVSNILAKLDGPTPSTVDKTLLSDPAEIQLATAIEARQAEVAPLFAAGEYAQALNALASLRPAVDDFFEAVMVMADDPKVRDNRLALLASLQALFLGVADIALLQQ
ncbi:glycine--tRNA ligase subunit beta [Terasakiispira papahanaumokuakeensis]|uniref:Glycine--tRNA ligase beta subunit n=1 Tax=Terasakiispira papahanaumokuakeensis TaxID=197479 RepID=A0A1E2VCM0_9GAMM|nr:glycine--tRNA ligase subunit beta [Terasakiispira papahanaumokuakeensis]ODC04760.1 glycine--tRNA ligase subunit beta [Terasakiispira papahanaumokuakeensis]